MKCAGCGSSIQDSAKFCPVCGRKVEPPKMPVQKDTQEENVVYLCCSCNAKHKKPVKFCPSCGGDKIRKMISRTQKPRSEKPDLSKGNVGANVISNRVHNQNRVNESDEGQTELIEEVGATNSNRNPVERQPERRPERQVERQPERRPEGKVNRHPERRPEGKTGFEIVPKSDRGDGNRRIPAIADIKEKYKNRQSDSGLGKGLDDQQYGDSYFDGEGAELLGLLILTALVTVFSCGFAMPWMICKLRRWTTEHMRIDGQRIYFNGEGTELLGNWVIWNILTAITCGLFSLYQSIAVLKWTYKHTFIEGESTYSGNSRDAQSGFDGGLASYIGLMIVLGFAVIFSVGFATPWAICKYYRWEMEHTVLNKRRLKFTGRAMECLKEILIVIGLSIVTFGIYAPWGIVRINKYLVRHTHFQDAF